MLDVSERERYHRALEELLFGQGQHAPRRHTQDSPVLPDVWRAYLNAALDQCEAGDAKKTGQPRRCAGVSLILTPHTDAGNGVLCKLLAKRMALLNRSTGGHTDEQALMWNSSVCAVTFTFEEMVQILLPITQWWREYVWPKQARACGPAGKPLAERWLEDMVKNHAERIDRAPRPTNKNDASGRSSSEGVTEEFLWMTRIIGFLAMVTAPRSRTRGKKKRG